MAKGKKNKAKSKGSKSQKANQEQVKKVNGAFDTGHSIDELTRQGDMNTFMADAPSTTNRNQKHSSQKEKTEGFAIQMVRKNMQMRFGISDDLNMNDGDQSILVGEEADILHSQWSRGMDYSPWDHDNNLSDWARALWRGDYNTVRKFINGEDKDNLSQMLEGRESLLNFSSIFHVINGARNVCGSNPFMTDVEELINATFHHKKEHLKIFDLLLELGSNINAKDVIGCTPLHHCCLPIFSNSTILSMAKKLLEAGANPNIQNRLGATPMYEPVVNVDFEYIQLLLEFGGDPDIQDYCRNISCRDIASHHPEISQMFSKADKNKAMPTKEATKTEAGGNLKACNVCSGKGDIKRCTGCFLVWYCSSKCQGADWSKHKLDCKKTKSQYRKVTLDDHTSSGQTALSFNFATGRYFQRNSANAPVISKMHCVVKVQLPLDGNGGPLFVYNKDRSLSGGLLMKDNKEVYEELCVKILREGCLGQKGYFYAIIRESDRNDASKKTYTLEINPSVILPVETW